VFGRGFLVIRPRVSIRGEPNQPTEKGRPMNQPLMQSMPTGRVRSFAVDAHVVTANHNADLGNCHVDRWLGGQDVSAIGATVRGASFAGAMGYSPKTTAKRTNPGNLVGGLT
jgi:hypothetical protein